LAAARTKCGHNNNCAARDRAGFSADDNFIVRIGVVRFPYYITRANPNPPLHFSLKKVNENAMERNRYSSFTFVENKPFLVLKPFVS
jgi:hypothetical protein